jgi:hypothetical protein
MQRNSRWKLGRWAWAVIAVAFLAPSIAGAQPGPKERRENRKERREEAKEKREEAKEKRKEAREDIKEERKDLHEKRKEARKAYHDGATPEEMRKRAHEVVEARKDLNAARRKARDAAKKRVKNRLAHVKKNVNKAALTAELRRHARIIARLSRAREVAEKAEDQDAMDRIDGLTAKENARHNRWLDNHAPEK